MMLSRSKRKLINVLVHVLVWALFGIVIFFRYPLFSGFSMSFRLWITQTVTLSLLVIAFYVNSSILVPRLLLKNKVVIYFVMIIGIVVSIAIINAWVETAFFMYSLDQFPGVLRLPRIHKSDLRSHIDKLTIVISTLGLVIGTSMTVIQKWQKDKQERDELEKEKVSSELSFLKAQINPHFFFNTLNNIYALTQIDANEAGKAIHQLSRMMRYLLYETQQGQTMLSQEIAFVKDYISLMQLRLTDTVNVSIDVPLHYTDMPMAPMILLPFVENAFKHGVSTTQQSHIYIQLQQRDSMLDIIVKNSIMKDKSVSLDTYSGIGLMNTRRRLDILYPGKYKLDISELNAANEYSVHLMIDLK